MPTTADLQAVKDYASGLSSDQRSDFISRYNSLSTDGKATLVTRIAGMSSKAPSQPSDTDLSTQAAHEAMLEHIKQPDYLQNVQNNIKQDPVAAMMNPVRAASNVMGTVGGVFQRGEDLAARGMQAYMNDNGADLPEVPNGQFNSVGAVLRGVGAPPVAADAAGILATGGAPGMAALGKGVLGIGKESLKLAGKAGLNLTKYFQVMGGKNPEEIAHLREIGYKNVTPETMASGGKFVQDLGDEMTGSIKKMNSRVQALWSRFNEKGATEPLHPTVTSNLAQEAKDLLSPQAESNGTLVDQILGAKVNKAEKPYEPITKVTKRSQVVTYPIAKKQYTTTADTTQQGGLVETTGDTQRQDLSEAGMLREPETVKEVESRTATNYPGRTQTVPVTIADTLNDMAAGKKFTSGQVKNLADMLSNIAGPGGQNNPRAAKLADLFKKTLQSSSPTYQKASDATYVYNQAKDAGDVLFGGAHDLYKDKASEASRITRYFDSLKGSPMRQAPDTIDGATGFLLGEDTGYGNKVKDAASVYDLANPKPGPVSLLGNVAQTTAPSGAASAAVGALRAITYGLGVPRKGAYISKALAGNSNFMGLRNAKVAALLNSPAGSFIRNSTAAQAGIKAAQGIAPNSDEE